MTVGCVLIGMYLPPSQSLYYADTEIDNGVSLLERCIIDILEETGEVPIIIFGDLNARTGNTNAGEADLPAGGLIDESVDSDSEDTRFRRTSKDITVNEFGRYLLCVCEQFDLIILNGLMPGDEDGKFTYIAHNGSSTIDYFIMSRSLVHMVSHLNVVSRTESKHMPVEMKFKLLNTFYDVANKPRKYQLQRYVRDQTKAQEYSATYSSEDISALFEHAVNLIDIDIEAALQKFNEGIYRAGHCMQRTVVVGNDKNNPWFDHECRVKRRLLRQTLRKYNKACNTIETADLRKKYSEQRKKIQKCFEREEIRT